MIGGQVGVSGHITVGNNVRIAAQSGIGSSIKDGSVIQGSPAFAIGEYQRSYVGFMRLPKMIKILDKIQEDLKKYSKSSHD